MHVMRSGLWGSPIPERAKIVSIRFGAPGGEPVLGQLPLRLVSRGMHCGLEVLGLGRRISGSCGERRAKYMFAKTALDAPIDVFGADPHVRALALRASNTEVTRHGQLKSPIMEPVNLVGISPSRYNRKPYTAHQEVLFFRVSILVHCGRRFRTGVILFVLPYDDLWAKATQAGVYSARHGDTLATIDKPSAIPPGSMVLASRGDNKMPAWLPGKEPPGTRLATEAWRITSALRTVCVFSPSPTLPIADSAAFLTPDALPSCAWPPRQRLPVRPARRGTSNRVRGECGRGLPGRS